jgi:hypothetical protein
MHYPIPDYGNYVWELGARANSVMTIGFAHRGFHDYGNMRELHGALYLEAAHFLLTVRTKQTRNQIQRACAAKIVWFRGCPSATREIGKSGEVYRVFVGRLLRDAPISKELQKQIAGTNGIRW